MVNSIIAFLFPSVPAVFHSDYPLAESVERLRRDWPVPSVKWFQPEPSKMKCTVNKAGVDIIRESPGRRNFGSFHFFGSFHETNEGVVLTGRFAMSDLGKALGVFWIVLWVFVIIALIIAPLEELAKPRKPPSAVVQTQAIGSSEEKPTNWSHRAFYVLINIASYIGSVKLEEWSRRKEMAWLSKAITDVLTSPEKLRGAGELDGGGG